MADQRKRGSNRIEEASEGYDLSPPRDRRLVRISKARYVTYVGITGKARLGFGEGNNDDDDNNKQK